MGADINVHDQWACESMGTIQDRTQEHLGQSDKAINAYRRLLRQAIEDTRSGGKPLMVLDPKTAPQLTGPAAIDGIGPTDDWQGYWQKTDLQQAQGGELGQRTLTAIARCPHVPRRSSPELRRTPRPVERRAAPAAAAVEQEIKRRKLETVRFSFCDQHGVLRGKTLVAAEALDALRSGVTMTTTLLAKDTSHRTVFPVFTAGGGMGVDGDGRRRQLRDARRIR